MISLSVKMKNGSSIELDAEGTIYAGYPAKTEVELYWPKKPLDKKRYFVRHDLVADWQLVEKAFCEKNVPSVILGPWIIDF